MKRIFKYEIPVSDDFKLSLPKGSEILSVQMQKSIPCLWALIDEANERENRYFKLYGTGMAIDDNLKYIGTFQMLNGGLVFHLFE